MSGQRPNPLFQRIYQLVRQVPAGRVTTYGRLARLAGTTPRIVGFAMAATPKGSDIPWQRVINSQGKISRRTDGEGNILQSDLLISEGIIFGIQGRVDLEKYGWDFPTEEDSPDADS